MAILIKGLLGQFAVNKNFAFLLLINFSYLGFPVKDLIA
jgi:hypothetical protein